MGAYCLPAGPVAVQFSGGRTSAFMLRRLIDAAGGSLPDRVHVLFQNTGREYPETLDFVQRCAVAWGVRIVWLEADPAEGFRIVNHNSASRDGAPFVELVTRRGYLPNPVARFCTQELKVRPSIKYMRCVADHWVSAIGIRADEPRRARGDDGKQRYRLWYPLFDAGVTVRDVAAFWRRQDFDLDLPSVNGRTPDGNCDGCFLKSEANRLAFARDFPDRAAWWSGLEQGAGATFLKDISWQQVIEYAERQSGFDFLHRSGMFCGAALGACTD